MLGKAKVTSSIPNSTLTKVLNLKKTLKFLENLTNIQIWDSSNGTNNFVNQQLNQN